MSTQPVRRVPASRLALEFLLVTGQSSALGGAEGRRLTCRTYAPVLLIVGTTSNQIDASPGALPAYRVMVGGDGCQGALPFRGLFDTQAGNAISFPLSPSRAIFPGAVWASAAR